MNPPRILTLLLVLPLLLALTPVARAAAPEQTAAAVPQPLTPQQAQQAIGVLENDQKRAELLQTLHAIAEAAPATTTSPTAAATTAQPAPAAASGDGQAAAAPTAAADKPADSSIPLT